MPGIVATAALAVGCDSTGPNSAAPPDAKAQAAEALRSADPKTFATIETDVRKVVNDATVRYWPLDYDTDEQLVEILDQAEAQIAAGASEPLKRYLNRLEPEEELDHFRETIRRWKTKTGLDLRATIDDLKADIAGRDPKQTTFPEFHKKFAATLADFVKLGHEELRERRNRMIHDNLDAALDPHRQTHPAIVEHFETFYSQPPYNLPASSPSEAPAESPKG
jgi:hypothetical protein